MSFESATAAAVAPHAPLRNALGRKRRYNYNEVVQRLADGQTMDVIAVSMNTSRRGVEGVVKRLRNQYQMKNVTHLVAHFLRNGWID